MGNTYAKEIIKWFLKYENKSWDVEDKIIRSNIFLIKSFRKKKKSGNGWELSKIEET